MTTHIHQSILEKLQMQLQKDVSALTDRLDKQEEEQDLLKSKRILAKELCDDSIDPHNQEFWEQECAVWDHLYEMNCIEIALLHKDIERQHQLLQLVRQELILSI